MASQAVCRWCGKAIEQPWRGIGLAAWSHPDLYDTDCDGVVCGDSEEHAEPVPT